MFTLFPTNSPQQFPREREREGGIGKERKGEEAMEGYVGERKEGGRWREGGHGMEEERREGGGRGGVTEGPRERDGSAKGGIG